MADEIDELLARFDKAKRGGDKAPDVDAILARFGSAAPSAESGTSVPGAQRGNPVVTPPSATGATPRPLSRNGALAVQAMNPESRRALAGMAPGPKPPAPDDVVLWPTSREQLPGANDVFPSGEPYAAGSEGQQQAALVAARERSEGITGREPLETDPIGQAVVGDLLGGGAGRVVGEAARVLGPAAARVLGRVAGGAVASKVQGGDPLVGAVIGGAPALAAEGAGAVVRGAPGRVRARAIRETTSGDTTANSRTATKVVERTDAVGDELFHEHPALEKTLATKAATNPRGARAAVQAVMGNVSDEAAPMLEEITKKTGGGRLLDISAKMDIARRQMLQDGHTDAAAAIDRARTALITQHGTNGTIPEAARLNARALQNMKNDLGRVAFAGDPAAPANVQQMAKRAIWGAVNDVLEDEGGKAGIDVARLRTLNRDMSVLMPMDQALEERIIKLEKDRPTWFARARRSAPVVGAVAGGALAGVPGAVLGFGAPFAVRAGTSAVRSVDWHLARLMGAAERGAVPASFVREAVAAGLPAATATAITGRARVVEDQVHP